MASLRRTPARRSCRAQLLDEYTEQSARYRELVAGNSLDKQARRAIRDGLHVDLRWILLHLTEETARHNGHLDILREMLDGTTGGQGPAGESRA